MTMRLLLHNIRLWLHRHWFGQPWMVFIRVGPAKPYTVPSMSYYWTRRAALKDARLWAAYEVEVFHHHRLYRYWRNL